MNSILCCDGSANGRWFDTDQDLNLGELLSIEGETYIVLAWPTVWPDKPKEKVAMWLPVSREMI